MKYAIQLISLLFLPAIVSAQSSHKKLYPVDTQMVSIPFELIIDQKNKRLDLKWERPTNSKKDILTTIDSIQLIGTDLAIYYKYTGSKKKYSEGIVQVMSIIPENSRPIYPPAEDEEPVFNFNKKNKTGKHFWHDAIEYDLIRGETYKLEIIKTRFDFVNCENGAPPEYRLKQQLPYFGAALIGSAFIGLGQQYNNDKKEAYAAYQSAWKNGDPQNAITTSLFDEANNKKDKAKLYSSIGWGTLLVASGGWAFRYCTYKNKLKRFNKWCGNKTVSNIQINPIFHTAIANQHPAIISGVNINWTF